MIHPTSFEQWFQRRYDMPYRPQSLFCRSLAYHLLMEERLRYLIEVRHSEEFWKDPVFAALDKEEGDMDRLFYAIRRQRNI